MLRLDFAYLCTALLLMGGVGVANAQQEVEILEPVPFIQPPSGYIASGKVSREGQAGASGATVTLVDPSTGETIATTTTDGEGKYTIWSVVGGDHYIIAGSGDHASLLRIDLEWRPFENPLRVDLTLAACAGYLGGGCPGDQYCDHDRTCQPLKAGGDECGHGEECESGSCVGSYANDNSVCEAAIAIDDGEARELLAAEPTEPSFRWSFNKRSGRWEQWIVSPTTENRPEARPSFLLDPLAPGERDLESIEGGGSVEVPGVEIEEGYPYLLDPLAPGERELETIEGGGSVEAP